MLKEIIAVFIGGGIGSSLRYLISKFSFINTASFPYSTFITNIIGCFILGLILGYFLKSNNQNSLMFTFLTIGICGGFTTFSTFSSEGLTLINNGNYSLRMFNGSCCRATGYDGYKHIAEIFSIE